MCRGIYGPYKKHYACFACRKSFKWPRDAHRPPPPGTPSAVLCPQCGEPMANMGQEFHPPRQRDVRQWRKVELLFLKGFAFHDDGYGPPGALPRTLREVPAFLAREFPRSEGETLLRRILARAAAPGR